MDASGNKHKNYEILNFIGYGLSKFDDEFVRQFGVSTKSAFYQLCIDLSVAETPGTVKNRMDLFDPFFPESGRKGWWQKGDAYIHRKQFIDNLLGTEDVQNYADYVKFYLAENFNHKELEPDIKPLQRSRFKNLQITGREAEQFFINNFKTITPFENGILDDARLFGDGYDFQVTAPDVTYLAEVKGVREPRGGFRLTEKEYSMASQYRNNYFVVLVLDLENAPTLRPISDPLANLRFEPRVSKLKEVTEYHLVGEVS